MLRIEGLEYSNIVDMLCILTTKLESGWQKQIIMGTQCVNSWSWGFKVETDTGARVLMNGLEYFLEHEIRQYYPNGECSLKDMREAQGLKK